MTYSDFKRLVDAGEGPRVDFKIHCAAFDSSSPDCDAAKAELAKDICALANNGNVASHIILGVSDDRQNFKSVSNRQLSDDNLQVFSKLAIFPPVSLRLFHRQWPNASAAHAGKTFVIIQVGPNPRHAYRLNQDFVDLRNPDPRRRFCLRRHQVWLRRGATSDLAAPEEVVRLLNGKPIESVDALDRSIEFTRLGYKEQLPSLVAEFQKLVQECDWRILDTPLSDAQSFRFVAQIRRRLYVLRCVAMREINKDNSLEAIARQYWRYEHGIIILALGGLTKSAAPRLPNIHYQDKRWGGFTSVTLHRHPLARFTIDGVRPYFESDRLLPANFPPPAVALMSMIKLRATGALRDAFTKLVTCLEQENDTHKWLAESRININRSLRQCLKEGWLEHTEWRYHHGRKRSALKRGEIRKHGKPNEIFRKSKDKELPRLAREVLRLSKS